VSTRRDPRVDQSLAAASERIAESSHRVGVMGINHSEYTKYSYSYSYSCSYIYARAFMIIIMVWLEIEGHWVYRASEGKNLWIDYHAQVTAGRTGREGARPIGDRYGERSLMRLGREKLLPDSHAAGLLEPRLLCQLQ
jgi:hypothetical protein